MDEHFNIIKKSDYILDIIIFIILFLILHVVFKYFDVFEEVSEYLNTHEHYELDELIFAFLLSTFIFLLYFIKKKYDTVILENHLKIINQELEVRLQNEINNSKKSLQEINEELNTRVQASVDEILEKDYIISKQSKMAVLGEMFEFIIHQSRQPLSTVLTISTSLEIKNEIKSLSREELSKDLKILSDNINYISSSMNDFRNFINPKKVRSVFLVSECISKAIQFTSNRIKSNNIIVEKYNTLIKLNGVYNELVQVMICIINNSIDELCKLENKKKYIIIDITKKENNIIIKIRDNANGVNEKILKTMFTLYNTTKGEKGTGLGLYMSKKIIEESFNGKIHVSNEDFVFDTTIQHGAKFEIILPNIE